MRIPVLFEPAFRENSIWYQQFREGMESVAARKKYAIYDVSYEDDWHGIDLLALVGTHSDWLAQVLERAHTENIPVLLSGCMPPDGISTRGSVQMDYAGGVRKLLEYLRGCGKRRPVLYGVLPNSEADRYKRDVFRREMKAWGIAPLMVENESGLEDCYRKFRETAADADCVLCVNDIAAASLIGRLHSDGIYVPRDVFVTAFGSTEIARLFSPSITTVALNFAAMGREFVSMYAYLARNESDACVTATVECSLEIAESTAMMPETEYRAKPSFAMADGRDFYEDAEVCRLMALESLLMRLDDTDRSILSALLEGMSYEVIAEKLDMPVNTLRYRARRMMQLAGVASRSELTRWMKNTGISYAKHA